MKNGRSSKLTLSAFLALPAVLASLMSMACGPATPETKAAERAGLEFCQDSLVAIEELVGGYVATVREGDAEAGEHLLVQLNRTARCTTPRGLLHAYDGLIQRATETPDPLLAPPLLLLLDAGARIIDGRGYNWLLAHRAEILEAMSDSASNLRSDGFFRAEGEFIVQIPPEQMERLLRALGKSDWLGRYCSIADLVWDTRTDQFVCPRDECPVVRAGLGLDPNDDIPSEYRELCDELAGELGGASSPGAAVRACFDEYRRSLPGSHILCIIDVWRNNRPIERILNPRPDISVEVSEACQLANDVMPPTASEKKRQELEDNVETLEADSVRLDSLDQHYRDIITGKKDGDALAAIDSIQKVATRQNQTHADLKEAREELDQFEKDGGCVRGDPFCRKRYDCSPDDPWCTDSCGARDPLLQQLYECHVPPPEDPVGDPRDPEDPVDPRVVEPLPGSVAGDSAFLKLANCLNDALTPPSEEDDASCSTCLRCADGEPPTRNDDGLCTCGGQSALPPGEDRCEQAIQCTPDGSCECPDVGEIPTSEPGVPVDPRVLLSVDSEDPQCVGLWTGSTEVELGP